MYYIIVENLMKFLKFTQKMKAKKKRVLVLGVHCLVNKWSGKIQLKVI